MRKHIPHPLFHRLLSALLCSASLLLILCACASSAPVSGEETSGKKGFSVVVTIFPLYDWVRNIIDGQEDAEVAFLMDSGVDLHSFQPAASDILKIASCDLFIYVGGESDAWVGDALAETQNPDLHTLNLLEVMGELAREEVLLEGMQEEEEEEEEDDGAEMDEHVWLSLRNASYLVMQIADVISGLDAGHADIYQENAQAYRMELELLDGDYREMIADLSMPVLLFCDRFPFRYLADDYGIRCFAAFSGCSAETEATFETIAFLAEKVKEYDLRHVVTLEGSDDGIARAVLESADRRDCTVIRLDSLQSVTGKDAGEGASYLDIMRRNLDALREALQ